MPDGVPQLLTLMEVATAMRVSPHTIRSWVRKGRSIGGLAVSASRSNGATCVDV